MKNIILTTVFTFLIFICKSQDLLDPYKNYAPVPYSGYDDWPLLNLQSTYRFSHYSGVGNQIYNGEYQIDIASTGENEWFVDFPTLAKSFKIETVSFPFTTPCALTTGCANGSTRDLYMPTDAYTSNSWGNLSKETPNPGILDGSLLPSTIPFSKQTLVSNSFTTGSALSLIQRTILPHTVLKHTLYIHCGGNLTDDIVDSVSWYSDLTRGRMRFYPFLGTNTSSGAIHHDIIYFPKFIYLTPSNGNNNHRYDQLNPNYLTKHSTINYYPYNEITNPLNCSESGTGIPSINNYFPQYIYPASFMLFSAPARSWRGNFLAGYTYFHDISQLNSNSDNVTLMGGIQQIYHIDKGYPDLDLNWINPSEKTIYNPSEVKVHSSTTSPIDLRFPTGYTFKTILGVYPSQLETSRANTAANGGPYSDPREVPVPVDAENLMLPNEVANDFPQVSWDDPATPNIDERYGYYYIDNLGQITVEPCVRIFDAKFEVRPGGTLIFEDYYTVINPARFTISGTGGVIAKNCTNNQYLQNTVVTQPQHINYTAFNSIFAGTDVDPNTSVTDAPYTIASGGDIQFKSENYISLKDGFSAKQGSTFRAVCGNILLPTNCPAWSAANGSGQRAIAQQKQQTNVSKQGLIIAPNPAQAIVLVACKEVSEGQLTIRDVTGRIVIQQPFNTQTHLNTSSFTQGIYIAEVRDDFGKSVNGKLVKE